MSDWSHGYDVSGTYTYGFFHEMAPDWLDLCARVNGYLPPRRGAGGSFRYLELGVGQGMGLCALAAANPQGEFLGVDFHPGHIAHAQNLAATAGLTNIRFVEADFVDLGARWPADFGTFDYVALHGIYSWVPVDVRQSVVDCIAHATHPGSLVYNSYNSQPGWLTTVPFQHLASRMKNVAGQTSDAALKGAIGLFDKLEAVDSAIFKALPPLKARLDSVRTKDLSYLSQEYLHESWHPLWHSEVAGEFDRAKLDYIGPANITDTMLPAALGRPLEEIILTQSHPRLRQDVQDTAINQTFRRDIFCRGPRSAIGGYERAIASTMVHLLSAPSRKEPVVAKAAFGQVALDRDAIDEVVKALGTGAKTIEQLAALPGVKARMGGRATRMILLMIHARIVAVGQVGTPNVKAAQAFNAAVVGAASQGLPYRFVVAAEIGSAISVPETEMLMMDCWLQASGKADTAALVRGAQSRLAALGRKVKQDGKPLEGAEADRHLSDLATSFTRQAVPNWKRLGMLAG